MIIKVKVFPKSGRGEVVSLSDSEYKVYLKSVPENNKANVELCKLLQRYFKSLVRIKTGLSSRNKIVEVLD